MNPQQNRQEFFHYWERNSPEFAESCQHEKFGQKKANIIARTLGKHRHFAYILITIITFTMTGIAIVSCQSGKNSTGDISTSVLSIPPITTSSVGNVASSASNYEEELRNLPQWLQDDISKSTETQASVVTTCESAETFSALNNCALLGEQACNEMRSVLTSLESLSDTKVERLLNAWKITSIRLCDATKNFSAIINQKLREQ